MPRAASPPAVAPAAASLALAAVEDGAAHAPTLLDAAAATITDPLALRALALVTSGPSEERERRAFYADPARAQAAVELVLVRSAREALDTVRAYVAEDVLDPGRVGLARDLLGRLRARVLGSVSGYGREEDKRRSREAGFDEHLTKPVDFRALRPLLVRVGGAGRPEERSALH